jgi:DNA-binding NtrC family response regulator
VSARRAASRLLVVEDNASLGRAVARALDGRFAEVDRLERGDEAVERLGDSGVEPYDVIVTDLRLPGADGLAVLHAARARDARTAVLLTTAFGSVTVAVDAMRDGAFDFLQKPFELDELEARVDRALVHGRLQGEVEVLREQRDAIHRRDRILGASPALVEAVALAERVAPTRSIVLLLGETGTGKELVAGLIHAASPRADGPYVKVNCAALPETLLESELFGHERGAFTSADRTRVGRFEQADGGTLFLDEVGDMSLATQAKLLRVLQDQEFQRLGGTRVLKTDVRIVAATNRDLAAAIADGSFREDLYFRLNVIAIELPPLRGRPGDVETLAWHFLGEFGRDVGRHREGFSAPALERLRSHAWPGNVRELRNVIERAVLLSDGAQIEAADLQLEVRPEAQEGWAPALPGGGLALAEIERAVVLEALERTGFVQKEAADLLRISRRKLNYKIQSMGITHPSWRRNRGDDS